MTKKLFTTFMIAIALFVAFGSAKAHAQIPIVSTIASGTDVSSAGYAAAVASYKSFNTTLLTNTTNTATAANTNTVKKTTQDLASAAAYTAAQQISRMLVAASLNAINGGGSGFDQPQQYIPSFYQYLTNITNQEVTIYGNSLLKTSSSDNPFAAAVGVTLLNSYAATSESAIKSTINHIPGVDMGTAPTNISTAGINGWDFYSQLAYPQNTPLGTAMIARDTLDQNIAYAQRVNQLEITSSGYKPQKTACDINYTPPPIYAGPGGGPNGQGAETNSGSTILAPYANNNKQLTQQQIQDKANEEFSEKCANQIITNPKGTVDNLAGQVVDMPFNLYKTTDKWYQLLVNTVSSFAIGLINTGISKIPPNGFTQYYDQNSSAGIQNFYNPGNIPPYTYTQPPSNNSNGGGGNGNNGGH